MLEKIAAAACDGDSPTLVEIGPGKGALTAQLLARAERVIAIEVDPLLVLYLRQKFREEPRLTIVESDVLKADLTQWGPAAIVGNLPYYITSPILEKVFATGSNWKSAVFLVQKEVAERITAQPNSRDYGYLTVQTQFFSTPKILFNVSRGCFTPPPRVESSVLRLLPHSALDANPAAFLRFVGICFHMKRKTLRNNLAPTHPAIQGEPEASQRAEQLTIEQLIDLYHRIDKK